MAKRSQTRTALNSRPLPRGPPASGELHWRLTELRPFNIGYPCNQNYDIT
jgi:hypothetical protein